MEFLNKFSSPGKSLNLKMVFYFMYELSVFLGMGIQPSRHHYIKFCYHASN